MRILKTSLEIPYGTTREFDFPVTLDGVPVDLTGSSPTLRVKRSVAEDADTDAVLSKWHLNGITIVSSGTPSIPSVYRCKFFPDDSLEINVGQKYEWTLKTRLADGSVYDIHGGTLTFTPSGVRVVTQSPLNGSGGSE